MDPLTLMAIMAAISAAGGVAENAGLFGGGDKNMQLPTMSGQQMSALQQALSQFGQGGGAGGALQHFQDLLSNDPEKMAAFEAPAMRQFNERIVPGIAERFSAMGGQRSSAFPQALSQAGADLSERLSAQRAGLQGQAATGIMSYLNSLLGQRPFENLYQQGGPGFFSTFGSGLGQGFGAAATNAAFKA